MTVPAFLFGALLATLYGFAFHLLRGGGLGRLLLFLILAWIGFWTGQIIASRIGLTMGSLGTLHLFAATIVSLIFLGLGHWLTKADMVEQPPRRKRER